MQERPIAFLLMPFAAEFAGLRKLIDEAGDAAGVRVARADDIFAGGVVIDQVKQHIANADVVIALCTGRNPNVFYELGLSDAAHRPILVAASSADLPFDIQHFRAQFYGGDEPAKSIDTLGSRLQAAIRETLAEGRPLGVPVAGGIARARGWIQARAKELIASSSKSNLVEDFARFGDRLTPILIPYLLDLLHLADATEQEGGWVRLSAELRELARWTELRLGPDQGDLAWVEAPRYMVWWIATAIGIYSVHAERWRTVWALSEQSVWVRGDRYPRLTLLDPGSTGDAIGLSRLTNDLERSRYGRIAGAYELVRSLGTSTAVQRARPGFGDAENLWRELSIYYYLSLMKAVQLGVAPDTWPWLYASERLERFFTRMRRDRGYRSRLAEGLFGLSVEALDDQGAPWEATARQAARQTYFVG